MPSARGCRPRHARDSIAAAERILGGVMTDTKWALHGREFANCNCSYGCPCQFNALPTYGNCSAVVGIEIDKGHHGTVQLDGLRVAGIFRYPGAIHMGNGEAV